MQLTLPQQVKNGTKIAIIVAENAIDYNSGRNSGFCLTHVLNGWCWAFVPQMTEEPSDIRKEDEWKVAWLQKHVN